MKAQDAHRSADTKPSLPLQKYAGTYKDAWYGPATIRQENGALVFTLDHTPDAVGDLRSTVRARYGEKVLTPVIAPASG